MSSQERGTRSWLSFCCASLLEIVAEKELAETRAALLGTPQLRTTTLWPKPRNNSGAFSSLEAREHESCCTAHGAASGPEVRQHFRDSVSGKLEHLNEMMRQVSKRTWSVVSRFQSSEQQITKKPPYGTHASSGDSTCEVTGIRELLSIASQFCIWRRCDLPREVSFVRFWRPVFSLRYTLVLQ